MRFIIFLILIHTDSFAQRKIDGYFGIYKVGLYGSGGLKGMISSFEAGVLKNNTALGIAYVRTSEIFGQDNSDALDVTIGRFRKENSFMFFHAQAGIGALWIREWNIDAEKIDSFFTVGVPLKAGVKFIPPKFLSIGIDLQANINSQKSMYMILLTLGVWHLYE